MFPALSVHVPESPAVALSPPAYVGAVHPAIPETASCPPNEAATGWLYQPSESGPRASEPPTPVGAVLSILIVTTGLVTVPQVKVAVHCLVIVPSAEMSSAAGHVGALTRSVGSTTHRIVTLLVCQPFAPAVPTSV